MRPRRALAPFRVQECCLGYFRLPSFAPLFVAATSNEITKEGRHVGPRDSHFSSIYDLIAGFFNGSGVLYQTLFVSDRVES